jgi:hypothetical protein
MTAECAPSVPTTVPFWRKPRSVLGLFWLTTGSERSHTLTLPFTLAPIRLTLAEPSVPHGVDGSLATEGALSTGFARFVTSPRYCLGYC